MSLTDSDKHDIITEKHRGADYRYVGRLAPSPSGHMHIGHAQTFLIACKRAAKRNGKVIMRIEDIDMARCKPQYVEDMAQDMRWIGVHWNAGYGVETDKSIENTYIQSKRFLYYEAAWAILYRKGYIYPCKLSRKDVDTALSAPHDNPHPTHTPNNEVIFPASLRPDFMQGVSYGAENNQHLPPPWQGLTSPLDLRVNWRFRIPDEGSVEFHDRCQGYQAFECMRDFGDFLVWRLDGCPAYELAVVVDDLLMGVTEVVRGEDLLLSTARQLLLIYAIFGLDYRVESDWHSPYPTSSTDSSSSVQNSEKVSAEEAEHKTTSRYDVPTAEKSERIIDVLCVSELLEKKGVYSIPQYYHVPLVCDEKGVRLAKRSFAKSLRTLREEGKSPEEIKANFLSAINDHLD